MHRTLLALLFALALPAQAGLTGWSTSNYASEPALVIDVPCTISFWIKDGSTSTTSFPVSLNDTGNDVEMAVRASSTGVYTILIDTDAASGTTSDADGLGRSTTIWRNVVAVFSSATNRRIYVNGFGGFESTNRPVDNTIDTLYLGTHDIGAGAANALNSASVLSCVAVWNVALTPAEVVSIHTGGMRSAPNVRRDGSLKHWIPCDCTPPIDEVAGVALTVTGTLTVAEDGPGTIRQSGMGSDTISGVLGSKLVSDYNPDSGVTGNPVTAWNDSVGSYHLNNVDGTPDVVAGPNGHAAIEFVSGSSEALYRTASVQLTATPLVVIEVGVAVATTNTTWWMGDKDVNDLHAWRSIQGTQISAQAADGTTGSSATSDDGTAAGAAYLVECIFRSATDRECRYDCSHYGTNSTSRTPSGVDSFAIGGRRDSTPDGYSSRKVWRILVLNAEPTSDERRRVMRLIDHLYGPFYDQEWPIGIFDPT